MRTTASVLHLDLDSFFAAVEQRDKPSLRGKPVIVGGVGGRGVVATASYEAREFGVRSAMSTREARARCPHAAFLSGRFHAYREASKVVMGVLRDLSPLVEPLSLDEAFVDLAAADLPDLSVETVTAVGDRLRATVAEATGGLTASVGVASSKFMAKVASELDKPDGLTVVPPGTERDLLRPMNVGVIPGVGPATLERLRRAGVRTVAELEAVSEAEVVRLLGKAQGHGLFQLARALDTRPVVSEREAKSISVEDTYATDLTDRSLMEGLLARQAITVARRLESAHQSGRTVTIKVRLHDFTTVSRSTTLPGPTDRAAVIVRTARGLLHEIDTSGGVRLLGVGVSGLADWVQEGLFGESDEPPPPLPAAAPVSRRPAWAPGADVHHDEFGPGWIWGSGRGVVTVRFETAATGPGPVRSFSIEDPALTLVDGAVEEHAPEDEPQTTGPEGPSEPADATQ